MLTIKTSHFFACLDRLKLIQRWSLMRNIDKENLAEHSLQVAFVAHALALASATGADVAASAGLGKLQRTEELLQQIQVVQL